MVGLRWVPNDEQSSEVLFGIIQDLDGGGRTYNLEASRRIGESFVLSAELRAISDAENDPILNSVANDDYLQIELGWYF